MGGQGCLVLLYVLRMTGEAVCGSFVVTDDCLSLGHLEYSEVDSQVFLHKSPVLLMGGAGLGHVEHSHSALGLRQASEKQWTCPFSLSATWRLQSRLAGVVLTSLSGDSWDLGGSQLLLELLLPSLRVCQLPAQGEGSSVHSY